MKFKMNVPNALTMVRIFCTPILVLMFLLPIANGVGVFVALGIYVLACFTDLLDGKIARKYNLVTNFGKFMDPIADKLLVAAALIAFIEKGVMPSWMVIILLSREFIISGFRLVAVDTGIVLAAGWSGKFKTATQMVMCCFLIVHLGDKFFAIKIVEQVLMYLSLELSVYSMMEYLIKNRKVIADM